jgi:ABC-type glycerol-3-phosphate transport system substrate-binding protein
MKRKQGYMAWALAILGLVCAMGCGQKQSQQTIRVSTFLNDLTILKITNDEIADIDQDKITTELAGGNAPDIIDVETNNFVDLYLRDVFENLKPYIDASHMDLNGFYPGVLNRFSRNGQVFVIPQDTAPTGLVYYNRKIFREAGVPYPTNDWSWPESFLSICKKLTKTDASGKLVRWAYSEAYPIQFENFVLSNGGGFVDNTDNPTKFTLDDPKSMEAMDFRYDLIYKYHVSPDPSSLQSFNAGGGVEQMFANGQIAMMSSGIWHTPKFLMTPGLDFDVVEFPSGPTGLKGWGSGGSGFAMTKASKNKDLAWKVIQELTSPEMMAKMASTGVIQPALISVAHSDAFLKSPGAPHKAILLDMPQYSHYRPFMKNWNEIMDGFVNPALDPVGLGEKKADVVMPGLAATINQKFFQKSN